MDDAGVHGILIRLREATYALHERVRREAPDGFGIQHMMVLKTLAAKGPQKQSDLVAVLGISKGSVSQTLAVLEARGFVERKRDEADARVYWIHMTKQARQFKSGMEQRMTGIFQDVFQYWSNEDAARMGNMLDGIIERANAS